MLGGLRLFRSGSYVASPFSLVRLSPLLEKTARRIAAHPLLFGDREAPCEAACGECEHCRLRFESAARILCDPATVGYEVWTDGGLVGLFYADDFRPGSDCAAHFLFFDGKLLDKTDLAAQLIEWLHRGSETLEPLPRITIEVPSFALPLARFAHRRLGFGGDVATVRGIPVEGVKRRVYMMGGEWVDLLVMARHDDAREPKDAHEDAEDAGEDAETPQEVANGR